MYINFHTINHQLFLSVTLGYAISLLYKTLDDWADLIQCNVYKLTLIQPC